MDAADTLLARLAARAPVEEVVALVVAHPDDEVIGAGGVLPLLQRLVLVHVTDGAPGNLADAHAHGFADAAGYAAERRKELGRALALGSPSLLGVVCEELGSPDQGASERLVSLTRALRALLARRGVQVIITHPYEGGHPDHDATAFIAAHAGLPVVEFASYHADPGGGMRTGAFLPGPDGVRLTLTPGEQARKRAMLAAFETQAATLTPFGTEAELFRLSPAYDFTRPPHDGTLHYERYDWGMTGERWRGLAAEARRELC